MRIRNLAAVYTGASFEKNQGRHPKFEESDFLRGPLDLSIDANGKISAIGKNLPGETQEYDGTGLIATSSFVDSHTHSLFMGERSFEYFMRWQGETYQSISAAGGGIQLTMNACAQASEAELLTSLIKRLRQAASLGVTHFEVKSGYAADAAGELRLLRILKEAQNKELPFQILPTFLGLHALPKGKTEKAFVDEMLAILPAIKTEGLAQFIDAFPEKGFFSLDESLRFAKAGREHGLRPKIHADELSPLGSAEAFTKLGALSVDHLQKVSSRGMSDLSKSKTVATLLPATSFFLGLDYAPAKALLKAGARVALATDFNPGTAPDQSPQFTMRLAASQFKMTAAEIFCAFTYNAAASVGLESQVGILQPGRCANVCLWRVGLDHALDEIVIGGSLPAEIFFNGRAVLKSLAQDSCR